MFLKDLDRAFNKILSTECVSLVGVCVCVGLYFGGDISFSPYNCPDRLELLLTNDTFFFSCVVQISDFVRHKIEIIFQQSNAKSSQKFIGINIHVHRENITR